MAVNVVHALWTPCARQVRLLVRLEDGVGIAEVNEVGAVLVGILAAGAVRDQVVTEEALAVLREVVSPARAGVRLQPIEPVVFIFADAVAVAGCGVFFIALSTMVRSGALDT